VVLVFYGLWTLLLLKCGWNAFYLTFLAWTLDSKEGSAGRSVSLAIGVDAVLVAGLAVSGAVQPSGLSVRAGLVSGLLAMGSVLFSFVLLYVLSLLTRLITATSTLVDVVLLALEPSAYVTSTLGMPRHTFGLTPGQSTPVRRSTPINHAGRRCTRG
jgi:hypothetical protein